MELSEKTIGDIAFVTKLAGFEHTKYIQGNCVHEKYDDSLVPLFIGKTVRDGKIDKKFDWYIPKQIAHQLPRSLLKRKCLVLPYVGTIGDLAVFDASYEALLGSNIAKIELNSGCGYSEEFVYYYLKSPRGQCVLLKDEQGGIQKNITMEAIRNVLLPKIDEASQNKIVSVLSALDDKIALNKKMNQKLEAMAKRLYDYWFVQFDFPDENGRPYKTTGGPMTHNETLKREIPEGWKVDVVGNVCETVLGGTPSTENESFWSGNIPWLNSGEVAEFPILNAEKRITEDAVKNSATAYLPAGSVTLSITRHLRPSIMAIDACINQSVAGIKENDILKNGYLYPYLVNEIPRLNTLRGGAQQPHINKDTVDKSPIVLPTQNVLHQYYEKVNPLYNEIIEKAKESQKLTTLRDKLLPLLMNGQVVVG